MEISRYTVRYGTYIMVFVWKLLRTTWKYGLWLQYVAMGVYTLHLRPLRIKYLFELTRRTVKFKASNSWVYY
jgi:hypothetical protein